jgi:hypothetical protein
MRHLTRTEFRHNPEEKQRWIDAADACGLSFSEFIRAALDHATDGTKPPRRKSHIVITRMDSVALAQLVGACNNLNQAVHAGHLAGMDVARIAEIAKDIANIIQADLAKLAQEHPGG